MKNKKIEAIWAVLCGSSSIDQETNNISLYKVLERLTLTKDEKKPDPSGLHAIPLEYEYVVLLQRTDPINSKEAFPLTLRISDPQGVMLGEAPIAAVFESEKKRLRIRVQNNLLALTTAGEYRYDLFLEGSNTPLASTPLEIVIKK